MASASARLACLISSASSGHAPPSCHFSALPLLQRQTHTQRAVDAADDLTLPAQDSGIAAQEPADAARTDGKDHRSKQAHEDEEDAQNSELQRDSTVFRIERTAAGRRGRTLRTSGFSTSAMVACRKAWPAVIERAGAATGDSVPSRGSPAHPDRPGKPRPDTSPR